MIDSTEALQKDLLQVEELLSRTISGSNEEARISAMCLQLIRAGGKRIRPRLVLLVSHMLCEAADSFELSRDPLLRCACAVELLHTATLVHDDIIDHAPLRRGAPTLNELYGNHAAVLAGDYMFARCFRALENIRNTTLFGYASNTVATLVSGELRQMNREGDLNLSVEDYREIIYCKTGALFKLCCQIGAVFLEESQQRIDILGQFGTSLGEAFQIRDDILDYVSDRSTLGKQEGADLEDQRVTLPLILALQRAGNERNALEKAVADADFATVCAFVNRLEVLPACQEYAAEAVRNAFSQLDRLPAGIWRDALIELTGSLTDRRC